MLSLISLQPFSRFMTGTSAGCESGAQYGNEQVLEVTDAHPFWVVTDEPDLERAARSLVDENGVWLYHANIGPTENGF